MLVLRRTQVRYQYKLKLNTRSVFIDNFLQRLINEIAEALELPTSAITPESDNASIEEWDSLGHISILSRLDLTFDNITERVPDLASAVSVAEIFQLLSNNGL